MSDMYNHLINRTTSLSVIGLGYVGLPLAIAFGEKVNTIGFDLSLAKIAAYNQGIDPTGEVGTEALKASPIQFTTNPEALQQAMCHIIAVPTPLKPDNTPDLSYLIGACEILGPHLKPGSIVVFESTVNPGVTEDVCIPALEETSGLTCGTRFTVGYSPERINPGDKVNRLETIVKIVSAIDKHTLDTVAKIYSLVVEAGVYPVSSIKVAEAVKVVENTQRDVNIAFMNEMALAFGRMGIDTFEVVAAMNTKWNALGFYPGLVGGHCISVDPHYFLHKIDQIGHQSRLVRESRRINEIMSRFVGDAILKSLIKVGKVVKGARIGFLGVTFKENTPDMRNSKVVDVIKGLQEYELDIMIVDPLANPRDVESATGITPVPLDALSQLDCVVLAVPHRGLKDIGLQALRQFFGDGAASENVVVDVKGVMDKEAVIEAGYRFWRM